MQIGILQTGHATDQLRETVGDYWVMFTRLLAEQGLDFEVYSVVDMEFPSGIRDADGWLITGSRHGVYDDLPWIPRLEEFIRDAHAGKVPMVGICFGHQIIAQALGGKVEKFAGGWAIGPQVYDWQGKPMKLNAWHQDQVTELPEGAEVLASHPFCEYAALAVGDRILTVQAHPEFDDEILGQLIETRGKGLVPDAILSDARRRLGAGTDSVRIAEQIGTFFKEACK